MTEELLVTGFVRRCTDGVGASAVVDRATSRALECFAGGASVSEACREGRRLVESCGRHPSRAEAPRPLRRAS
jgi:hypothetical protein